MKEQITFNSIAFGLPVETFRVSAHIALEERLPVVTEFVLRLLYVCGRTAIVDVTDYFGFEDSEALALLESLSRQGLVSVEDDEVGLSLFASERFEEAGGEHPRFSKVELKNDTVTFDLRSFTPLGAVKGPLPSDNIIKLDAEEEAIGNSIDNAKMAYRQRYPEIASMRQDLREKSFGVYSIEDIESRSRSYLPVPVNFAIDQDGQVNREVDSYFELIAPPDLVHFLNEEITGCIPRTLSLGHSGIDEFIDAFNIQAMRKYLVGQKFDLSGYVSDVHFSEKEKFPKGMLPIIGNLYLPENRERILTRLDDRREGRRRKGKLLSSAAWLAPDYRLWGRGSAFAGTVNEIRGTLRGQSRSDELFLFAAASEGEEASVTNRFRVNSLRELHFFRKSQIDDLTMHGRLELFFYPGGFVAAVFHASVPGTSGLWVPIGFISTQQRHLETVHKILCRIMGSGRYAERATFKQSERRNAQSFEEACGFLCFDDLPTAKSESPRDTDNEDSESDRS